VNLGFFIDELEIFRIEIAARLEQRGAHRHRPEGGNARLRKVGGFEKRLF